MAELLGAAGKQALALLFLEYGRIRQPGGSARSGFCPERRSLRLWFDGSNYPGIVCGMRNLSQASYAFARQFSFRFSALAARDIKQNRFDNGMILARYGADNCHL
jgi:hypothetical protein